MSSDRDRDAQGRARQARPRDELGRPLPYGSAGVEPVSEDPLPPSETIGEALLTAPESTVATGALSGTPLSTLASTDPAAWIGGHGLGEETRVGKSL